MKLFPVLLLLLCAAEAQITQKMLQAGRVVGRKAGGAGREALSTMLKDLAEKEVKGTIQRRDSGDGTMNKYVKIVRKMQSKPGFEAKLRNTAQAYAALDSRGPTAPSLVAMMKAELKKDSFSLLPAVVAEDKDKSANAKPKERSLVMGAVMQQPKSADRSKLMQAIMQPSGSTQQVIKY